MKQLSADPIAALDDIGLVVAASPGTDERRQQVAPLPPGATASSGPATSALPAPTRPAPVAEAVAAHVRHQLLVDRERSGQLADLW